MDASANKRIVKNTLLLYFRTFITLLVGLYTSRVMLAVLGVENYGINNVVGGIVSMSSIITGAVSATIVRFITYALGEGNKQRMKLVFSTSVNVQIIMSIIAVVALEIGGIWFLNTVAVIPEGRMEAAHWVLQCSILTLVLGLISSPYNAVIVAHEHMAIYAYMSIVDVLLKLGVCFAIMTYGGDRLICLALLNVGISITMRIFYGWYCGRHFREARYDWKLFDRSFLMEMFKFTSWYVIGNVVWVLNTHGLNLLTNVFFGVLFNAARGVAMAVTGALSAFVNNFTTAIVPQITKSYAAGDRERLISLLFQGTRFTWYLLFVLIIPIFLEADTLLKLWLRDPPEYANIFLRFALIESWALVIGVALFTAILASGKPQRVQKQIAFYTSVAFPLTWFCFKTGAPAWAAYVISIVIQTTVKGFTIYELKRIINFPMSQFMTQVVLRCTIVTIVSFVAPTLVSTHMPPTILRLFVVVPISLLWSSFCVYALGLDKGERVFVGEYVRKFANKFK